MYIVTYSGARGAVTRTIGEFEDFEVAEVAGHEDDDYAIWIEAA